MKRNFVAELISSSDERKDDCEELLWVRVFSDGTIKDQMKKYMSL